MSEPKKNPGPRGGGFGGHRGGFGRPVEKAKDFKGTLKRLLGYLSPHRVNLVIVLIFAIFSTAFTIAAPKISSKAMNKLQDGYMAKMMLENMSEVQIKAHEQITLELKRRQEDPATIENKGLGPSPEARKALEEFMQLPMLDKVQEADEKAKLVQKIIELSKEMPVSEEKSQPKISLTQEQINGALKAITETNGEYDFHYIGIIILILLGIYLLSASFSLIMGLVMSGVSQKTVGDLRREVDNKLA